MITYSNKSVIVLDNKQKRPNGKPKIEGIGILVRKNTEANTFTIYYVDSKTVQDYKFKDYFYCDCVPGRINNLSISTYICLDKTRGFFDLNKLSYVLPKFDGVIKFDEIKFKLECDLNMYGKMYLNIKEGILVSILKPEQMEEILSKSPNTSVLQFLSWYTSYFAYPLVSINYNSSDVEDIINQLKEGLTILDSYILNGKDNFNKNTYTSNTISHTKDRIGFKCDWLDTNTKYDYTYAWFNPSRNCGKTQWLNNLGTSLKTFENITATEIEQQRFLKKFHQEYMKSQEVRKMLYKLDFTIIKGKRYVSYGKHNGEEISTITTTVSLGGRTGKATVDEKDYDERQGILEALGNAIYGSFETEYQKYCRQRNKEDKKLRICTICGKLYDTQDEARACEKAHKERKEADAKAWTIRKEAIRRLKEQTYEDSVQSEMNRLKNKQKDEDKKNKTTE